ncbi:MAG: hypothetical protein GF308_13415 [Candidatus Heimdallarchaeota archaeon]|nr:hypothetical protein [Candidatus Heimdallarchaeota archaeon]
MSFQIIPNMLSKDKVDKIVEKKRVKRGGILLRRAEEKLTSLQQILWPIQRFKIQFTLKSNWPSSSSKIHKQHVFMLGNFSKTYVEDILHNKGGKKALALVFSKEKTKLLNQLEILEEGEKNFVILPCFDARDVYSRIIKLFNQKVDVLEQKIEKTKTEVQPLYDEAKNYEWRAENARDKAVFYADKKESERRSEYNQLASEYSQKAQQLRDEAKQKVDAVKKQFDRMVRRWYRGQRKYLGVKKKAQVEKVTIIDTFYYHYWLARFDSSQGTRFLILNNKGRQVKKLQIMMHLDAEFREKILQIIEGKTKEYSCFSCGQEILKEEQICSKCGEPILRCSVCKLPISQGEPLGICPLCQASAHLIHLQEAVKVTGKCPSCLQDLLVEKIISTTAQVTSKPAVNKMKVNL